MSYTDLSHREHRKADRAAQQREDAIAALRQVTDADIARLIRRNRLSALPDGHKTRTLSDGQPSGTNTSTTVEAAAEALLDPAHLPDDTTRSHIDAFFAALAETEKAANRVMQHLNVIRRLATIREYKSGGMCRCCGRDVPGTETDRLRSLYCHACHRAWLRAGRPDNHGMFVKSRLETLATEHQEVRP